MNPPFNHRISHFCVLVKTNYPQTGIFLPANGWHEIRFRTGQNYLLQQKDKNLYISSFSLYNNKRLGGGLFADEKANFKACNFKLRKFNAKMVECNHVFLII